MLSVVLILISCTKADESPNSGIVPNLVGSWDLVEYDQRDEAGTVVGTYYGDNPSGNLIYTASGDMSVHLVDPRVREFKSGDFLMGSSAEIKEAYEGYFGYFGTYTVDEQAKTVTHHVTGSSFRGYTSSYITRYFELEGDRLSLMTGLGIEAGVPRAYHSVWKRSN